jgi:signal transduction histidine kinase
MERRATMASITHDLKTPISSIVGYAEGILDGIANTPEKVQEYADIIRKKGRSLQALSEDLSLLARLDSDQLPLDKWEEDIGALIGELASEFVLTEPDARLETHIASNVMVAVDREKIARVIVNLFQNSLKYKKPEQSGPEIALELSRQGESARLTISDNGLIVAQGDLPHLFDRFYRADESRGRQSGSGLGLSIARQLVHLHGGKIWVLANPDGGLTVNILLPLVAGGALEAEGMP